MHRMQQHLQVPAMPLQDSWLHAMKHAKQTASYRRFAQRIACQDSKTHKGMTMQQLQDRTWHCDCRFALPQARLLGGVED